MDKGSKKQSLIVKVICLLLSFGLWLYISNVENPVRSYELKNIPVELINTDTLKDSKFAIASNQEFKVDLKLEGSSSDVLKAKKEDFKIVADMSAYALKSGDNTIPVQIVSYPENINIKNNGFLGIKVKLEDLIKKDLLITSKVNVGYKSNIYEKEKTITPSKVTISGARSAVEKVNEAVIEGDEKDIDKNTQISYDIKFLDASGNEVKDVEADNTNAQLNITIIKGKSVPINLKTIGTLQKGLYFDGFELNKSSVNIAGNSEILDNIKSIDTNPLDISELQSDSELSVTLNVPEGITIKDGVDDIKAKIKIRKDEDSTKDDNSTKDDSSTKDIVCNVNYTNLNENLVLESSTQTVNVSLSGTQSMLEKITADNIHVTMDLSKVTDQGTFEYTPVATLINAEQVTVSSVGNVNIIIKKKFEATE